MIGVKLAADQGLVSLPNGRTYDTDGRSLLVRMTEADWLAIAPALRGRVADGGLAERIAPELAEAAVLLRASEYDGSGAWVNEGSLGDTVTVDADGTTHVVVTDELAAVFLGDEANASTCPDAADLDLTTGFCLAVDLEVDWAPAIAQQVCSKPVDNEATHDCYAVGYDSSGHPFIEWNDAVGGHNGPSFITDNGATATVTFPAGVARRQLVFEFVADNGSGGWTARIYEGDPADPTLLSEIVNTTDGAQTMTTSSEAFRVGDPVNGKVYRVRLYDELGGTLLRDFYPERDWSSGLTMTSGGPQAEEWSAVVVPTQDAVIGTITLDDADVLDPVGSATFVYRLLVSNIADVDNESITYSNHVSGGFIGQGGTGRTLADLKISGFGIDGFGVIAAEGGAPTQVLSNTGWDVGVHTVVEVWDRSDDTLTVYVDGAEHATASIAGLDVSATASLVLTGIFHGYAAIPRALTASEIEAAAGLLSS